MTEVVYVMATALGASGVVHIRVYRDGVLIADAPLSCRRAMVLASDLLSMALIAERTLSETLVLDAAGEDGVANSGRAHAKEWRPLRSKTT